MQVLITNGGTHLPSSWADYVLDELVYTEPNNVSASIRSVTVKSKLRPYVEQVIATCIAHEKQAWDKMSFDEKDLLVAMVNEKTNQPVISLNLDCKHVYDADYYVDMAVQKLAKVISECDGDKPPTNQMIDNIYNCLKRWFNSISNCERRHAVTSRNL